MLTVTIYALGKSLYDAQRPFWLPCVLLQGKETIIIYSKMPALLQQANRAVDTELQIFTVKKERGVSVNNFVIKGLDKWKR